MTLQASRRLLTIPNDWRGLGHKSQSNHFWGCCLATDQIGPIRERYRRGRDNSWPVRMSWVFCSKLLLCSCLYCIPYSFKLLWQKLLWFLEFCSKINISWWNFHEVVNILWCFNNSEWTLLVTHPCLVCIKIFMKNFSRFHYSHENDEIFYLESSELYSLNVSPKCVV